MLAWHVPFLGWRRLPADLSEFEIAHFFTLKSVDIRAVHSRYKESLRLGAALQLGFLTMCGSTTERTTASADGVITAFGRAARRASA